VDVVYTTGEEFRGYISVEAPLCSRTLFGSDEDDEVIRLRNQAKDILETGYAKFSTILDAFWYHWVPALSHHYHVIRRETMASQAVHRRDYTTTVLTPTLSEIIDTLD
jgi:hypothetical protein